MRIRIKVFALGFLCVVLGALGGYAQENANDASLGDIARHLKAQKSKEPKPVMVITNDNIPTGKAGSGFGITSSSKSETPDASPANPAHGEAYYRSRLAKLQDQLDTDKRELDVMQQKLSQNQMQYYPDPNKALHQEYSRSDINKGTDAVDAQKKKVAADEQAIEDLHDQLRREGGDPGWLR